MYVYARIYCAMYIYCKRSNIALWLIKRSLGGREKISGETSCRMRCIWRPFLPGLIRTLPIIIIMVSVSFYLVIFVGIKNNEETWRPGGLDEPSYPSERTDSNTLSSVQRTLIQDEYRQYLQVTYTLSIHCTIKCCHTRGKTVRSEGEVLTALARPLMTEVTDTTKNEIKNLQRCVRHRLYNTKPTICTKPKSNPLLSQREVDVTGKDISNFKKIDTIIFKIIWELA